MSTAALTTPYGPTLFELEQGVEVLYETEPFVSPEQEGEFRAALAEAMQASVEKRDRVGGFIRHCQMQQENVDAEIERLVARKQLFENAERRMRQYVQHVIESLGQDAKGKYKKLEGKTVTFSLRAKPGSVEITDSSLVPGEHKNATVKLPFDTWAVLCDMFSDPDDPMYEAIRDAKERVQVTCSKADIKRVIDGGGTVPGADLLVGGHTLVVT